MPLLHALCFCSQRVIRFRFVDCTCFVGRTHVGAFVFTAKLQSPHMLDYPPLAYTVDPATANAAQTAVGFPDGKTVPW
jgi:hypothetical protein